MNINHELILNPYIAPVYIETTNIIIPLTINSLYTNFIKYIEYLDNISYHTKISICIFILLALKIFHFLKY